MCQTILSINIMETTYPEQDGVFLTKRMPIKDMPYAREHIVDGELVSETDTAIIEVVPDTLFHGGGVQMVVDQCDYVEETVSLASDEGLALLRDAGVNC